MRTGTRLDPILRDVAERAAARRKMRSAAALRRELRSEPQRRERFVGALSAEPLSFIAECKRRSPSAGAIGGEADLAARVADYRRGGAGAVSILTEADHFGGSLADLAAARANDMPVLRKDFLLDEGMVLESLEAGADAILLIACCLPGSALNELARLASELGLASLIEVHDEAELERALEAGGDLVGVNARDLTSFHVDLGVVERLLPRIPAGPLRVAESGLHTIDDLRRVRAAGADVALVGTALMRAEDPCATLASWRSALDG